jgi:phage host-nuclease inhibitor protein Gam
MGYVYTNVEIGIDSFLDQCDDDDIQEVIEYIQDEYPELLRYKDVGKEKLGNLELEYQSQLNQLIEHVYKFTKEEEQFLETMFRKYL